MVNTNWRPDFTKADPYEGMPPELADMVSKYYTLNPIQQAAAAAAAPWAAAAAKAQADKAGNQSTTTSPSSVYVADQQAAAAAAAVGRCWARAGNPVATWPLAPPSDGAVLPWGA